MAATQQDSRQIALLPTAAVVPAPQPPGLPMRLNQSAAVGVRTSRKEDRDSYSVTALADMSDRALHASLARFTAGVSPAALVEAYFDWATHLTYAPGKRTQLMDKAIRKAVRFGNYAGRHAIERGTTECCIEPLPQDRRFTDEGWQKWPFNLIYQGFLLQQQWWHNATTGIRGVSKRHEEMVEYTSRQILDMVAPSNFPLTNPEILYKQSAPAASIWQRAGKI